VADVANFPLDAKNIADGKLLALSVSGQAKTRA